MNRRSLALACLFPLVALAAPACVDQAPDLDEDTGVAASAAAVTKLYASEGDLDLIVETLGTFEDRDGVRALILHGTANRYLEDVYSFVPDDIFGDTSIISERRFEIVLHEGHELNTVLSGLPLFVAIHTFTGNPNQYTARLTIAPRFYDFRGATAIWIDEEVQPFYVVNGTDNLVYRGLAGAPAPNLFVTAPNGAPVVSATGPNTFKMDWSYTAVHQAIDPHTVPLTFLAPLTSGTTIQKTSRLVGRVVDLALTSGDAYDVWPAPECQPAVYTCTHSQPAGTTDFAACGSYREVARCNYADACDVLPPEDLALEPIDTSALEPAQEDWNLGSNSGAWHELTTVSAFETPECPAEEVTIQAVMAEINWNDQNAPPVEYGTFTDRAGLAQSVYFEQGYYGDGAALLAAIDSFTGGGDVQAWLSTDEISCHNCHDFAARAVLYFPASGKVVVLDGHFGYDS